MNEPNMINLDDGWALIQTDIDKLTKILDNPDEPQFKSNDYMKLYTIIFNLCTQNAPNDYSSELHERYKKVFEDYLTLTVFSSLSDKHDEILLKEFVRRWSNHKVMVQWLSRLFKYLDRYYLPDKNLPLLKEEGMFSDELCSKVRAAALSLIDQDRDGGQIDLALLWDVVYTFVELGMGKLEYYENKFESFMIQETSEYYSRKVYEWTSQEVSCSDYMPIAEQLIQREHDRVCYLHPSSEAKLMEIVQNQLLSLANNLLMDGKFDDLSKMYKLFCKHVTDEGMAFVKEAEGAASYAEVFIKKIIELHDKYHKCVNDCFKNDTSFRKAPRETLEMLCNKDIHGTSGAELLAIFSDNILKKNGSEKLSYEDIEHTLEKVVKLVEYLRDKDAFAEYYWEKLALRLLFHESVGVKHEMSILFKLKQAHSRLLTRKLRHMLNEFTEVSNARQSRLTKYLAVNTEVSPVIDLSLTLLTSAYWPTYKTADLKLPEEMVKYLDVFKGFIEQDEKIESEEELPKKYTWGYSFDTCKIMVKFDETYVELIVTTYQASALLLFNMSDRLSYKEIMIQLNLPADDVDRILQSLSCASLKILIKEPDTDKFSSTDIFELNSKFTSKRKKFKIPLHPLKVNEKKIDAAIVRLMKSRKVMSHEQLLAECKEQLQHRFEPDVNKIKKRIESLMEREYLERDKADASKYRYMPASFGTS